MNKLKTVPGGLNKVRNVVNNDVVKKTVHNQLVVKFSAIDSKIPSTSGLVNKTQYDSYEKGVEKKIEDFDKKIPNAIWLDKKIGYNAKIM